MTPHWNDCYFDHYVEFFGEPVDGKRFRGFGDESLIEVYAYDGVFSGSRVFCTVGLSRFQNAIKQTAEVYTAVDDAWDMVPFLVANTLFYIIRKGIEFGWGISINGIEEINPQFAEKYKKAAVYFTLPADLPMEFNKVQCGDEIGKVYSAVFLSEKEHQFVRQNGPVKFEEVMSEKGVDPFALSRSSAI